MNKNVGRIKTTLHLATALLLASGVQGAGLLEEHFSYTNGNLGNSGVGSALWPGGDSPNNSITVNSNAALNYPGLAGPTGSGVIFSGGTFKKKAAPFAALLGDGTNVYCSFLLNIQSVPNTIKAFVYLQDGNSASSSPPLGVFLDSTSKLGLGKSVSSPAVSLASGLSAGTHLVVVRYRFLAGNDQVDLWVDPASLGNDGSIPAADLVTGGSSSSDASALSYVFLNHAVSQTLWIDELRVGASWSDVTPTNGSVVPPVTVPYVTQTFISAGALVLRGTNGPPSTTYTLLAATNLSLPAAQWPAIATNAFDANGNFDCTNPIFAGVASRFYRLLVGGQTSAPPTAPSIAPQPQSQTVGVGQNATFFISAGGTMPLSYQWYFNANTPLPNATTASLTLTNVSTNNAGGYLVIVTNVAGSVTSIVATLTVTSVPPSAPTITGQPQNQTVTEGQTVNFSVTANGSAPLSYQWYFNTNTPLADKTNATLTLNAISTNDAGGYSVIVTNPLGSATSTVATLTVNVASTNLPDFSHVGFGNEDFTVTGAGSNAPSVVVTTGEELNNYSDSNTNVIIYVSGTLQISGMSTHVRANKTVIGLGNDAILEGGGLYLYKSTNVIIRNLTIRSSTEDDIGLHYSTNVWIDHCTFVDATDGELDITQQSDKVTVSWCKFYYTANPPAGDHRFVSLIAANDAETGEYHVTYHHNWWSTDCVERMPSVRFGRVHAYNNLYNAPGNNYCVRSRLYAECLIENNYFQDVQNPWEVYITNTDPLGKVFATNNILDNITWTGTSTNGDGNVRLMVPGNDPVFGPPYSYSLDSASSVPNLVTNYAGAGQVTITP